MTPAAEHGTSADETLFRLALADWPAHRASLWWDAGVTSPDLARFGHTENLLPFDVKTFAAAGAVTPAEIRRLRHAGYTSRAFAAIVSIGVTDRDTQLAYIRALGASVIVGYVTEAGVASLDDLVAFHAHRITPAEIVAHQAAGRSGRDSIIDAAFRYPGGPPNTPVDPTQGSG